MKKLNTWIDYLKLVIVSLIFLLGSMTEPLNKTTLFFLLSALAISGLAEFLLIKERKRQELVYARYISRLERAVQKEVRESEYDAA